MIKDSKYWREREDQEYENLEEQHDHVMFLWEKLRGVVLEETFYATLPAGKRGNDMLCGILASIVERDGERRGCKQWKERVKNGDIKLPELVFHEVSSIPSMPFEAFQSGAAIVTNVNIDLRKDGI